MGPGTRFLILPAMNSKISVSKLSSGSGITESRRCRGMVEARDSDYRESHLFRTRDSGVGRDQSYRCMQHSRCTGAGRSKCRPDLMTIVKDPSRVTAPGAGMSYELARNQ